MSRGSLHWHNDGVGAAWGYGVAHPLVQRGLDGVGASLRTRLEKAESETRRSAEIGMGAMENDNYTEVATTSTWWASDGNDNYGGGDDNYSKGGVEMGAVEREEGRGRDRQK